MLQSNGGHNAPIFMALIDGTGASNDAEYAAGMVHSFCRQISDNMGSSSYYQRGPSWHGLGVKQEAENASEWLLKVNNPNRQTRLFLAGYSRGASAAILAAEHLKKAKVNIEAMFLFDAVARHVFSGGEVVPTNVLNSYHAMRTSNPLFVSKYEGSIDGIRSGDCAGNPARPSFGNAGLNCKVSQRFTGSHGALGGTGWRHVTEDVFCQHAVGGWMSLHLTHHHIDARLTYWCPTCDDDSSRIWMARR